MHRSCIFFRGLLAALIFFVLASHAVAQTCDSRRPVSLYFAVDTSGSMSGSGQAAASSFGLAVVNALDATGSLNGGGLLTFDNIVYEWVGPAGTTANLRTALSNLGAGGGTALYDGINWGVTRALTVSAANERLFVLLTDGEESGASTSSTRTNALNALIVGPNVELIFVNTGTAVGDADLVSLANSAGPHVNARSATTASLNNLVTAVVNRTCQNFRPDGAFSISPSATLVLGQPGFTLTFNGTATTDVEDNDSALNFAWTFTGPGGGGMSASGISPTMTFNDSQIGSWTARMTVTDTDGASHTVQQSFTVEGVEPDITANASPPVVDALDPIQLTAGPTTDVDGGTLSFQWRVLQAPPLAVNQPPGPGGWTGPTLTLPTLETDITLVGPDSIGVWRFEVTATDNEGDTDIEEVIVDVRNLPPEIDLVGDAMIPAGAPMTIETLITEDLDGGVLSFNWDLVQVPDSAGLPIQDSLQTGAAFSQGTLESDAGTWIFRLRATDNEGEEVEEDFKVLVDGLPEAEIVGAEFVSIIDPFTLSGEESFDPDSPCPTEPDKCHQTDGRPVDASGGIATWRWSVLDVPPGQVDFFSAGPVEDSLGVSGSGPRLEIPSVTLREGIWRFQLEVIDDEGNSDFAQHSVEVIFPDGDPFAFAGPFAVYPLTDDGRTPAPVIFSDAGSFDLDDVLNGEAFTPGVGIIAYSWSPVLIGPTCPAATVATGAVFPFIAAGTVVPPVCTGVITYQLTVTDNDTPTPRTGTAKQTAFITACRTVVCILEPTNDMAAYVAFSDETDIEIPYTVDQTLYALSGCLVGCIAELLIFSDDDLGTPVFTASDPTVPVAGVSQSLLFKWNGFVRDPVSGAQSRPEPGTYTTEIRITNLDGALVGQDVELSNIRIAVADVTLNATEDLLSLNGAEAGTDTLSVDYDVSGGVALTEMQLVIVQEGTTSPEFIVDMPPVPASVFEFDGQVAGSLLDPGDYTARVRVLGASGVLDESDPWDFTAFALDLELDMVAEADEEMPGVDMIKGAPPKRVRVTLRPAGLTGTVEVIEDGTDALGPPADDWQTGLSFSAAVAAGTWQRDVTLESDPGDDIDFVASYAPPSDPAKEARDSAVIRPIAADLTAACSDDAREDAEGIFVQRRPETGPVMFAAEAPFMRRLEVVASRRLDDVVLDVAAGDASRIAVFAPASSGTDPVLVTLPYTVPAALFSSDRLESEIFVRGLAAGEVELRLAITRGGMSEHHDTVKLRIDDLAPLVGRPFGAAPHWRALGIVNAGEAVQMALDPERHDERRGKTAHIHVVERKTAAQWQADPGLVDVSGGIESFVIPAAGNLSAAAVSIWPAASVAAPGQVRALDVVLDFGDCSMGAAADGQLGPEDIVLPFAGTPALTVLPDLRMPGPLAFATSAYGDDFETAVPTTACDPAEDTGGAVCAPGPQACDFGQVCSDGDGDGTPHCTAVDPAHAACGAGTICVNTNDDERPTCRPEPVRVSIPIGYDGLLTDTIEGGFRLRGQRVFPSGPGPFPLVMIAHGNHMPKIVTPIVMGVRQRWSEVAAAITDGQNYAGHTYLQELFASYGIASVSVDLDQFVGARSLGYVDVTLSGIDLRGWVLLKHLEQLMADPAFGPRVDGIHLMGHSRGGEAVLSAWHILGDVAGRGPASLGAVGPDAAIAGIAQADIRSVVSLSPTTAKRHAPPLNAATPYLMLFGTHDRDVDGFQFSVQPQVLFGAARPAAAVWLRAANHNYFNDAWPQDSVIPGQIDITRPDQKDVARAYLMAWFRMMGGENAYAALFERDPAWLRPAGVNPAVELRTVARLAGPVQMLDDFNDLAGATAMSSTGIPVAFGVSNGVEAELLDPDDLGETDVQNRFKQSMTEAPSRGQLFDWNAAGQTIVYDPAAPLDLSDRRTLVMSMAQQPLHPRTTALAGPVTFEVTLTDMAGVSATAPSALAAEVGEVMTSQAHGSIGPFNATIAHMNDVRLDLHRFRTGTGPHVDLTAIDTVSLTFGGLAARGRLAIDNIEFE